MCNIAVRELDTTKRVREDRRAEPPRHKAAPPLPCGDCRPWRSCAAAWSVARRRRAGTRLERHVSLHGVELLPCGVCVAAAVGVREAHTAVARCAQPAAKAAPHPRQAALGSLLQLADRAIGAFLRTRASFTSMCARPIPAPAEALSAAHALWPLSLCPLLSASLQDSTSVRWRGRAAQRCECLRSHASRVLVRHGQGGVAGWRY